MIRFSGVSKDLEAQVLRWQQELHTIPEVGFQEFETTEYLKKVLEGLDGVQISQPTPTGLVAELKGGKPGKTVAYRTDIDALPITEAENHEVRSIHEGVMHACGHDGHMSMALGALYYLHSIREELNGNIRFIFQPGEECPPGGASKMIEAGVLEGVSAIIGCHLESREEPGRVCIIHGAMLASTSTFTIRIHGRGGHAASPHLTIDPIVIGAQIVSALQSVVSRRVNPLDRVVVSVTQFHAGAVDNVIADEAMLGGTVRILDNGPDYEHLIPRWMEETVKGIAEAYGATCDFVYEDDYQGLKNDDAIADLIEKAAVEAVGREWVFTGTPNMAGDDMGNYLRKIPGCYYVVGCRVVEDGEVYPNHHARFLIDPASLPVGTNVAINALLHLLQEV